MGKGERSDNIKLASIRAALDRATVAEALNLVEAWNAKLAAKQPPQFSPTIGCAINAGMPWLRLHCPGCRQVYELDLRRVVRPRDFPNHGTATGLQIRLPAASATARIARSRFGAGTGAIDQQGQAMTDPEQVKELREKLLEHLESALAITDTIKDSVTGYLIERALSKRGLTRGRAISICRHANEGGQLCALLSPSSSYLALSGQLTWSHWTAAIAIPSGTL